MTTNVPSLVIDDSGISIPLESEILSGVQLDIDMAFGGGVDQSLSTPQGQLAQSLAAIISDKNMQIAEVINQFNPDIASGRWQDAIGRIYFIDRIRASGTVVSAKCIGAVGTRLPAGIIAKDTSGYLYESIAEYYIGSSGYVTVNFQCKTLGAIPCQIGALSIIHSAIGGWDRVENLTAGVIGNEEETRSDFEIRRRLSVAKNASLSIESIRAAILGVNGVIDAYVIANDSNLPVITGVTSYSVAAHSIYCAIVGGQSSDIANAIWSKKAPGSNMNGNTTFTVFDESYPDPKPQYIMRWVTPSAIQVKFVVSIKSNSMLPGTINDSIKTSILKTFSGQDGRGCRATIGKTIYASRFYDGINETHKLLQIISVQVGVVGGTVGASLGVGIDQSPTLSTGDIVITTVP